MPGSHRSPAPSVVRLVAGYDGSLEARFAVVAAAHAAGPTGEVAVVVAGRSPQLDAVVAELTDDAIPPLKTTRWSIERSDAAPAEAILALADRIDAAQIVIGTRGRGRAGALLGSVAQQVLHGADRPVLVVTHRTARRLAALPAPQP